MNLRDFVKETLVEIAEAVDEANDALKDKGAFVNPVKVVPHTGRATEHVRQLHEVEFDVAVTAEEGKETKGGLGIMVGTIGLGAQGKSETSGSTHSRVKFKIPLLLPNPK